MSSRQHTMFDTPPPKWWAERRAFPDLDRVNANLSEHVFDFCLNVYDNGGDDRAGSREFHMGDLVKWVLGRRGSAPSSPDRILRQLRIDGLVSYTVVNRSQSLYRIDQVRRI